MFPVIEIGQVIREFIAFRRRNFAIEVAQVTSENSEFLQVFEIRFGDYPVNPFSHQNQIECVRRYRFIDTTLVDESLDDQVVIDFTLDNAGVVQFHETVDHHLRCGKQPFFKRCGSADPVDNRAEFFHDLEAP